MDMRCTARTRVEAAYGLEARACERQVAWRGQSGEYSSMQRCRQGEGSKRNAESSAAEEQIEGGKGRVTCK